MTVFHSRFLAAFAVAGGLLVPVVTADADTVAYWRFEEGSFLTDSSGNGHHLTNGGSAAAYTLPATGAGSDFPNPILQTGASNATAVQRTASESSYLSAAYHEDFASNAFTIEAMVHVTSRNAHGFLAGRWNGNNSSYAIYLRSDGTVDLAIRNASNSTVFIASGFTLALDTDYYLAVAVDLTAAAAPDRSATFYLQNLTDGGQRLSNTQTNIDVAAVREVSSTPFSIGAQGTGGNGTSWAGVVDEVRYSSHALVEDELLVVPEPGGMMLLGIGGLLLAGRRRE